MHKKILIALVLITLATLACQLTSSATLRLVNHPQTELPTADPAPFEAAGCTFDEYGTGECSPDSPFAGLGCDQLRKPGDLFGGLNPAYPLALCLHYPLQHPESTQGDPFAEPRFYNDGCMMPVYVRYVIYQDGKFEVLRGIDDLRMAYAPIDSPDEALSYSLAATGLEARYNQPRELSYRYFVDRLEDTTVIEAGGGYQINLFDYQLCGCGPHTTSIVTLLVSADGQIQTVEEQPAYENPAEDGLCID